MWLLLLLILKTLPITQAAAPLAMTQVPSRHSPTPSLSSPSPCSNATYSKALPCPPRQTGSAPPPQHRLPCHCFLSFTASFHVTCLPVTVGPLGDAHSVWYTASLSNFCWGSACPPDPPPPSMPSSATFAPVKQSQQPPRSSCFFCLDASLPLLLTTPLLHWG